MTVKQLKEKLESLPDNMEIFIRKEDDEFDISYLSTSEVRECSSDGKLKGKDTCLVLSDEI